jgi:hypothetical protein
MNYFSHSELRKKIEQAREEERKFRELERECQNEIQRLIEEEKVMQAKKKVYVPLPCNI